MIDEFKTLSQSSAGDILRNMGQKWLKGQVQVTEWKRADGTVLMLSPKQQEIVNSKERMVLACGGVASGKTLALLLKAILLCLWFPNNSVLLGRRTRSLVEKTLLPFLFELLPAGTAEYRPGKGLIQFFNGSEIVIYGLEAMQSGSQQDIRKAEQDIRGLNLGGVFIDQLEEVEQRVWDALRERLRRPVGFQQMMSTANPYAFWAYDYFKQNPRPNTKLFQISTLENKDNLPIEYLEDSMTKGDSHIRRFVYGEWTKDIITSGHVFDQSLFTTQILSLRKPIKVEDGTKFFEEPADEEYQVGVDPSSGAEDPGAIQVVSKKTGRQVAVYREFVPVSVLSQKAVDLALYYSRRKKPLIIPEANDSAVIELMKRSYPNIYSREVINYREQRKTKRLGFYTNRASKENLIEHFRLLLKKGVVKISDPETLEEFKTFVWIDEVAKMGAGAQYGNHDDRVMALLLAYWGIKPETPEERMLQEKLSRKPSQKIQYQYL